MFVTSNIFLNEMVFLVYIFLSSQYFYLSIAGVLNSANYSLKKVTHWDDWVNHLSWDDWVIHSLTESLTAQSLVSQSVSLSLTTQSTETSESLSVSLITHQIQMISHHWKVWIVWDWTKVQMNNDSWFDFTESLIGTSSVAASH